MLLTSRGISSLQQGSVKRQPAALKTRFKSRITASAGPTASATGPRALTEAEETSLQRYQASVDKAFSRPSCLSFLQEAARTKNAEAELVEGALLALEQRMPEDKTGQPAVTGRWRLVFSTATKIRAFQYIPVQEELVIASPPGDVALESSVGPFSFNIKGSSTSWEALHANLQFQFNKVEINFLGSKIWTVDPKTKPKTYTFFYVDDTISGARSSGGGISLLRRL